MEQSDPDRPNRSRGLALLLALLYGLLTGGALPAAAAEGQPFSASAAQAHRAILVASGKDAGSQLKAKRQSPDPLVLPPTPTQVWKRTYLATSQQAALLKIADLRSVCGAYRARAPPAA